MKKVIALDIGGVCLEIKPERCFAALGYSRPEEVPAELLLAADRCERGLLAAEELLAKFKRTSNAGFSDEAITAAWNSILHAEMPGMRELVGEMLNSGVKIVLFSDTSAGHMKHFRDTFAIAELLPDGIYSFEVGAKKPEAPMYAAFEARHGRPSLYIDDRQVCIDGGVAFGWPTHRFRSVDLLRAELAAGGLLS